MASNKKLTKREFTRRKKAALRRKRVKMSSPKTYQRPEEFMNTEAPDRIEKEVQEEVTDKKVQEETAETKTTEEVSDQSDDTDKDIPEANQPKPE